MTVRRTFAARWLLALALAGALVLLGQVALAAPGDRDDDGLKDRFEERWGITDPDRRDTDRDGIRDGLEDEDADRLSNLGEQLFKTDPTDPDSDDDGTKDGGEDSDRNGVNDALEQDRRPVPSGLSPSLSEAFWDVPTSYSNGCHTGAYSAIIHPCVYGAEDGDVRVTLFGDSHALQWLPALDRAGDREGWRVTTLTKTACPSVDVAFTGAAFEGTEKPCRRWRQAALDWLQKNRQDVVIITNTGRYPVVDETGERVYEQKKEPVWQDGLARVIDSLPKRSQAVVLADTPHLNKNPVSCLKQGEGIISDCVTRRARTLRPEHDDAERETAEAHGALFADLNDVVCPYDPCPIVSGTTLMWRNESHLTATYAEQLAPAMRSLVEGALEASTDDGTTSSGTAPSVEVEIVVDDDRFEPDSIEASAGDELIVTLTNVGREKHNIAFYAEVGGLPIDESSIGPIVDSGKSATTLLVVPASGEFVFQDDEDPDRLRGTLIVTEAGAD